jgi:hypothetical protein
LDIASFDNASNQIHHVPKENLFFCLNLNVLKVITLIQIFAQTGMKMMEDSEVIRLNIPEYCRPCFDRFEKDLRLQQSSVSTYFSFACPKAK